MSGTYDNRPEVVHQKAKEIRNKVQLLKTKEQTKLENMLHELDSVFKLQGRNIDHIESILEHHAKWKADAEKQRSVEQSVKLEITEQGEDGSDHEHQAADVEDAAPSAEVKK